MKMKPKQWYSRFLALILAISLMSGAAVPAIAADSAEGSVVLSKSATLTNDGSYKIDLSGFVTGQTITTQVTTHKPLDVVLVLDASSSMLKFKNTPATYVTTEPAVDWGSATTPYPATATSNTNLWAEGTGMSRKSKFYSFDSKQFLATSTSTLIRGSVMIPVKPGDKIYCSSFRSQEKTGGAQDGICVTFYRSSGNLLKSVSAADVYAEFTANNGKYITVPEKAYVMNVPVWNADPLKRIYNRSLGDERYNPVNKLEFEAVRAKILQKQVQSFADALAANSQETGANHKLAIVTFGGGDDGTGAGKQGKFEKHVGVNGFSGYLFTNSGLFFNGQFKNYFDRNKTATDTTYPFYEAVFAADLDTAKTYYYFEPTESTSNTDGTVRTAQYDTATGKWLNTDGEALVPQATPYEYNSRTQFYTMEEVAHTKIDSEQYKAAMSDVLVGDALNPKLQYAIDRYFARGSTHTELGMAMADFVLANNKPRQDTNKITGKVETSKQIVILFTDGNTHDLDKVDANGNAVAENAEGTPTYQTIFYRGNRIKDKGADIYTISVADAEEGAEMEQWMDQLSSNHPDVVRNSKGEPVSHTAAAKIFDSGKAVSGGKYFKSIADMSELSEIFTSITTDISTSKTGVELGKTAVMQDYLANGLKLPDDFGFSNISVYAESVNATSTTSGITYTSSNKRPFTNNSDGTYTLGGTTVTVSFDKASGRISATGFNYSYHYVSPSKKGNKLIVEISGVEATDATPTDCLLATNTNQSGIAYVDTEGKSGLHPFEVPKTQLASQSYVMDYAKPLTISAADWGSGTILGFADSSRLKIDNTRTEFETGYGTFTKNADGTTFTFTPNNMQWGEAASFYVLRTLEEGSVPADVTTGANQWLKVSVAPANNIYYEDDFTAITYDCEKTDTTDGNWTTDGTNDASTEEHHEDEATAENGVHGWESSLADAQYSNGSAHKGVVSEGTKAEATFQFTGTGVDIYSRTESTTGTVLVSLEGQPADGSKAIFKMQIVDTQSVSGTYDQIPAVSFMDLPYGTYTVIVRVTTAAAGRYTYYLDGVRVYNPLLDDSFYTESEHNAAFTEIRDLLEQQIADTETGGAVFIDKAENGDEGVVKTYSSTEYGQFGPKNEVYLANGQSITFKVSDLEHASYYVGLKCPNTNEETTGQAKVSFGNDVTNQIDIAHSTDLYYEVIPNDHGCITIENTGSALLSVTKLRIAGAATEEAGVMTLSNSEALNAVALFSMLSVNSGVEAPDTQEPVITLKWPTLMMEDFIKLKIFYTIDQNVDPAGMGLITWTDVPEVVDINTADAVFAGAVFDADTGMYSVNTDGIPAQNLGDTIYFCVYAALEDGSIVYSKQEQYSPTTYAYNLLNGNESAASKALLVSVLNYGAAAQTYLGYNADALINADLTDDLKTLVEAYNADMVHSVPAPSASKQGALVGNGGFSEMIPSITLEGAFSINYFFTPDRAVADQLTFYYWNAADFEAADVLSIDNATGSWAMTNKDGTYSATIGGIAAKDIDSALYACGVYTDAEGNTYSTGVLPYSLGAYCGNQAKTDDNIAELAKAIAVYGYYAAGYFV